MWRTIFYCAALLSILSATAAVAGQYQPTKDGKVIVWNDDPLPGDAATWFGDRDKEGYATGVGELTWYTGDGELFARYFGNMERGKFNGAVNAHSRGKTVHATFVEGKRSTGWIAGRATLADRRKSAPVKTTPTTPQLAKADATIRDDRPQPDLAKAMQDSPAEGPAMAAKEKPAPPRPPEGKPQTAVVDAHKDDTPKPAPAQKESKPREDAPKNGETPDVSDFLGPPSALRRDPLVEAPSTAPEPDVASSPSAAQLTSDEAVAIADSEARARGFDLNSYDRPKADYSKVKGKWSLVYQLKDRNVDAPPHVDVTVDDDTKKVEIRQ